MRTVRRRQPRWPGIVATLILAAGVLDVVSAGSLTGYVDPFIGTDGTGHVMPGASMPWGMVAPGPDQAGGGWDYTSGYQYRTPTLLGFSNTHISGAGIPELGDVLLQPAYGLRWNALSTDFATQYDKASETASPGYYAVRLPKHAVKVELTATGRVALHRYTFDRKGRVQVLLDLQHGLLYGDGPRVRSAQAHVAAEAGEVSGTVHTRGWTEREASFVVRFDRPIAAQLQLPPRPGELGPRYLFSFDLGDDRTLQARVALSTVDVDGARRNLAQADGLTFDAARARADAAWDALLGRIEIEASDRTRRIFYSALYRTLLHPSDIADADGRVRGPRGEVIQAPDGRYDSTLSLWDTFRAVHPLYTLVYPERVTGFVNTHARASPAAGLPAAVDRMGPRDAHHDRQPGPARDRRRRRQGFRRLRSASGPARDRSRTQPGTARPARRGRPVVVEALCEVRLPAIRPRRAASPSPRPWNTATATTPWRASPVRSAIRRRPTCSRSGPRAGSGCSTRPRACSRQGLAGPLARAVRPAARDLTAQQPGRLHRGQRLAVHGHPGAARRGWLSRGPAAVRQASRTGWTPSSRCRCRTPTGISARKR